jgi:hypothetical protein
MMSADVDLREWNAACVRLEDFLRAHRIEDRLRHVELVAELLAEARGADASGQGATERVMAVADARVERWFVGLVDGGDSDRGRAAYYSTGIYRRWPGAFLCEDVPAEMREAMRSASVQAGPDLEFSSLIRKEVNYGPMEDLARETWATLSWGHVLRAFLIWAVVFVAVYGFYLGYLA